MILDNRRITIREVADDVGILDCDCTKQFVRYAQNCGNINHGF